MFTGLIEEIGKIREVRHSGSAVRLSVTADLILEGLQIDDSVAVNGVCLTVVLVAASGFEVDAVDETLRKSTLGDFRSGGMVNLERCLLPTDRLGGHIVQGHVDCTGRVAALRAQDAGQLLTIKLPAEKQKYVIAEGSIAVDGVSLTVARLQNDEVTIALIPHTLAKTTLGRLKIGDAVNIEVDLIGKYVERMLHSPGGKPLTAAWLKQVGF